MTAADHLDCTTCYHSLLAHWPTGNCKATNGVQACGCERFVGTDGKNSDDWPGEKA